MIYVLDIIFSKDTNKQIRAVKAVHIKSELYKVTRKLVRKKMTCTTNLLNCKERKIKILRK